MASHAPRLIANALLSPAPEDRTASGTHFLDLDFADLSEEAALRLISSRGESVPFGYVVTPNVDHMVRLQQQRSDLWPVYRAAWLTLCDSRILSALARSTGKTIQAVPGSDLTAAILGKAIMQGDRIAIIGGNATMIERLCKKFGLGNLIHHNPPMGFVNDAAAMERAVAFAIEARARYTFLAVGSPQQEILAYRIARSERAVGTGLCIGASLEFLTGDQRRAPVIVQKLALEWLFRLATNPSRLTQRYLVDGPRIFPIFNRWRARAADTSSAR